MSPDKLAEEANAKIKKWASGKDKLIVAVDGYVGVGKTTLLDNLLKLNPDILPVHFDDRLINLHVKL